METKRTTNIKGAIIYTQKPKVDEGKQHSLWYGGEILNIYYRGYRLRLSANGDVWAKFFDHNKEVAFVKDENNSGLFADAMGPFIKSDQELKKLMTREKPPMDGRRHLWVDDCNWWEVFVYNENEDFVYSVHLFTETYDEVLQSIIDRLDEYIAGKGSSDI